jgi:hypothetical protein
MGRAPRPARGAIGGGTGRSRDQGRVVPLPRWADPIVMDRGFGPRIGRRAVLAALAAALLLTPASQAAASPIATPPRTHGTCSGPSHWALAVHMNASGGLTVRFALGGGAQGQRWHVFMDDDGAGFFQGARVSVAGGVVRIVRRTANLAGVDTIRVSASDTATLETCRARAGF